MKTMTSSISDILESYNNKLEQQDICPKFGGAHDYERIDSQFISQQVVELDLICLQCGTHKYVYNYLEESEL